MIKFLKQLFLNQSTSYPRLSKKVLKEDLKALRIEYNRKEAELMSLHMDHDNLRNDLLKLMSDHDIR